MNRLVLPLICGTAFAGCERMGPEYQAPTIELRNNFVNAAPATLENAADLAWWDRLNDPLLTGLIARGSSQNLDVRTAIERSNAAEAALGRVGLNAQLTGGVEAAVTRQNFDDGPTTLSNSRASGSYVVDLFGEHENRQTQAQANLGAAQANVDAVRLAYLADITNAYLQARYYQEAAAISRMTVRSRRQTLRQITQRRDVGDATELDVQRARSELATSEATLPTRFAQFETSVFRIATLLAEPAQPIMTKMQAAAFQPRPHGTSPVGHPADLIRNRPDVRAAEQDLIAATAAIGIAEAQLLPSISLSGTLSAGATDGWSFGPKLSIPILNRGALEANQQIAESQARTGELTWRATVLKAVEEVQIALSLSQNLQQKVTHLEHARDASKAVVDLSRRSYQSGVVPFTDVLNAERQHAANQLAVADALREYAVSWMDLQIAIGQGASAIATMTTQ
ncbi:efflux transporter outer membrane subunit [Loktanella sp. F6476L]|uniref:efflux transporter outer membrane subunit n=1 Tax=Loktanella sp. F6476L TaxID=2926405 RepID=UPI001FF5458F|nr:efflux transporter outer membrane subunit [Loktanella sp. F6476L]MCK0122611.1 efflux transporter outer membrane subunit [Loktanella sp. F6476L]